MISLPILLLIFLKFASSEDTCECPCELHKCPSFDWEKSGNFCYRTPTDDGKKISSWDKYREKCANLSTDATLPYFEDASDYEAFKAMRSQLKMEDNCFWLGYMPIMFGITYFNASKIMTLVPGQFTNYTNFKGNYPKRNTVDCVNLDEKDTSMWAQIKNREDMWETRTCYGYSRCKSLCQVPSSVVCGCACHNTTGESSGCPEGWYRPQRGTGNVCYNLAVTANNTQHTFNESVIACEDLGGTLPWFVNESGHEAFLEARAHFGIALNKTWLGYQKTKIRYYYDKQKYIDNLKTINGLNATWTNFAGFSLDKNSLTFAGKTRTKWGSTRETIWYVTGGYFGGRMISRPSKATALCRKNVEE